MDSYIFPELEKYASEELDHATSKMCKFLGKRSLTGSLPESYLGSVDEEVQAPAKGAHWNHNYSSPGHAGHHYLTLSKFRVQGLHCNQAANNYGGQAQHHDLDLSKFRVQGVHCNQAGNNYRGQAQHHDLDLWKFKVQQTCRGDVPQPGECDSHGAVHHNMQGDNFQLFPEASPSDPSVILSPMYGAHYEKYLKLHLGQASQLSELKTPSSVQSNPFRETGSLANHCSMDGGSAGFRSSRPEKVPHWMTLKPPTCVNAMKPPTYMNPMSYGSYAPKPYWKCPAPTSRDQDTMSNKMGIMPDLNQPVQAAKTKRMRGSISKGDPETEIKLINQVSKGDPETEIKRIYHVSKGDPETEIKRINHVALEWNSTSKGDPETEIKLMNHVSKGDPETEIKRIYHVSKGDPETEIKRINHVALERIRRKKMGQHLVDLKSLIPSSYLKKTDQASIISGATKFIQEMEGIVASMEREKLKRALLDNPTPARGPPSLIQKPILKRGRETDKEASGGAKLEYSVLAANINHWDSLPQSSFQPRAESKTSVAAVEVKIVKNSSVALVNIMAPWRAEQLIAITTTLESFQLKILCTRVLRSVDVGIYRFIAKVGSESPMVCPVDQISAAIQEKLADLVH